MEHQGDQIKIAKLKGGDDWNMWKFQMRILLIANEVFDVVDGTEAKPAVPEADALDTVKNAYKKWCKKENNAQKYIATSVEKGPMMHIVNSKSSKDMWEKLESVYENKTDTSIHIVQQRWFALKKDPNDDISTHIAKIEDLCYKLNAVGEKVSDSMLMTKILMTLPSSYNHFISAWESTGADQKTIENLSSRLMMEESRISRQESETESALVSEKAHGRYNNNKNKKYGNRGGNNRAPNYEKNKADVNNRIGVCWNCNKKGHKAYECWSNPDNKDRDGAKSKRNFSNNNNQSWYKREQKNKENEAIICEALLSSGDDKNRASSWILDSGATSHMSPRREWFSHIDEIKPSPIKLGDGSYVYATGVGRINIETNINGTWVPRCLEDVLYAKDLVFNLYSQGVALNKGMRISADKYKFQFLREKKIMSTGNLNGNTIFMNFRVPNCNAAHVANNNRKEINTLQLWHERLAHQNYAHVKHLLKENSIKFNENSPFCEACVLGKMHRKPFPTSKTETKRVGEIIHADVCGPMEENSVGGSRYFLLLKDDFSSYMKLYFLKSKAEVFNCLNNFVQRIEKETGEKINILRTDNGLEFCNKEVKNLTLKNGIQHQRTVVYTPQQNGKAERENRTLVELARTMLLAKNLPKKLWAEAVNCTSYVLNRSRKTKIEGKSPYEIWSGQKESLNYFKIFGTEVYTHIPKELRKKWDSKAKLGIFVGYDDAVKGYRVYNSAMSKISVHRDVRFKNEIDYDLKSVKIENLENFAIFNGFNEIENFEENPVEENQNINFDVNNGNNENNENEENFENFEENNQENEEIPEIEQVPENERVQENQGRQLRNANKPTRFGDNIYDGCGYNTNFIDNLFYAQEEEPQSYKDAIKSEESKLWMEAMQEEIKALKNNKTWKLVEKPSNAKILKNRWVFKLKTGADGSTKKHRARLVVKGYLQEEGLDYTEVFSPVARYDSVRSFLAIAASKSMKLKQFDVKTAFLNGDLEETIYMEQPQGFQDKEKSNKVCKLSKSLYGLKQAARCWNKKFIEILKDFNMHPTDADPCVFTSKDGGEQIILILYVDDGALASKSEARIESLLSYLKKRLEITVCDLNMFLGIEIKYLPDGSFLAHQDQYAKKVVQKFHLQDANAVRIPADNNTNLSNFEENEREELNVPYKEAIGSLMFLAMITRPDIAFAVGVLSRYAENPTKSHWNGIKRVIKYVKGTTEYGLIFRKEDENLKLISYSDADFAGDVKTRKSTSGYIVKLGNSLISWSSRKQDSVALSTTESEFVAACAAVQEIVWNKSLISDLIKGYSEKPLLYVDNMNAINNIKNPKYNCKTKHIDVKYKYIREKFQRNVFDLQHVSSDKQQADILTKALPIVSFERLRKEMGISNGKMYV